MESASQVQNCHTIDSSSRILDTSGEKHDCPAIDCSNQKQSSSAEKHVLVSRQLQSEPVETMIIGSVAQNCQTTGSSIPEQNMPDKEHEMGSKHVTSEAMDIKNLESVVEQKFHTSENSTLKESTLGGKPESDSNLALGELMVTTIMEANTQNCQTKVLCHSEISSEHVQGEPMETRTVESDSFEVGLSGTEARAISDVQNCQTTGLSDNCLTSGEKHEMGSEHVSSEPMDIGIVEFDAPETCHITGSSILKENMLEGKPVPNSKVAGSGAHDLQIMDSCRNELHSEVKMETKIVGCDFIDVGLCTETMILETVAQNSQTIGSSFLEHAIEPEHISSDFMDIMVVGSDAVRKCQITENAENTLGRKSEHDSKLVPGEPMETSSPGSNAQNIQEGELKSEDATGEPVETMMVGSNYVDVGLSGTPPMCATDVNGPSHEGSTVSSMSKNRKSTLTSTPGTARALRPRLNGLCKPPEPTGSSANVIVEKEKKRKKIKRTKKALDDEFSRTRKRLRYILTRMAYEHNFIDAYSGEGWKGQSAEKIKPEKELQRATSEILRCKRKIRELFQHLDSSCAEGRFQESLFDSEGQISSEDIFCAKCQSQELSADNDIILCDGICDRGFHQMCLEPPLLKEDIPPGDESWLCPGCDCKVGCIEILNDSQGTNLAIDDSWEKVFPEAADKAAGDMTDDFCGLPSDDSEDDEYNPDAPEVEEEVDTEGSSSDDSEDSDFTSASDDLEVRPLDDPYLGLPSDDSEDDEYNPNALDLEQPEEESSSSDFTSASEYFSASSDAKGSPESGDGPISASVDCSKLPGSSNELSKMPRSEKQSADSELLSILEPDSQGDLSPVSGKRQRERLDYKKLHDEAYGNVPSDSSEDDEDWAEADAPPRKKDDALKETSQTRMRKRKRNTKGAEKKDSENTSKRRKLPTKDSENETHTNRTLGEAVTQRLYASFKENQYPTRVAKEDLAKEVGLRYDQITKWFGNARWSLRHQSSSTTSGAEKVSPTKDQPVEEEKKDEVGEASEAGTPKEESTPGKLVEAERKICRGVTTKEKCEEMTPKAPMDVKDETDRTVVISMPANSPKTKEVGRKGRKKVVVAATKQVETRSQVATPSRSQVQTRSRKALTPTTGTR